MYIKSVKSGRDMIFYQRALTKRFHIDEHKLSGLYFRSELLLYAVPQLLLGNFCHCIVCFHTRFLKLIRTRPLLKEQGSGKMQTGKLCTNSFDFTEFGILSLRNMTRDAYLSTSWFIINNSSQSLIDFFFLSWIRLWLQSNHIVFVEHWFLQQ